MVRRLWSVGVVVVLAVVLAGCEAPWSSWRYGAGNTGANPAETKVVEGTVGSLTKRFTASIGEAVLPMSGPIVSHGQVFVAGRHQLQAYGAAGTDGCSGAPAVCTPRWTADLGATSAVGSPTVTGDTVLVTTYESSGALFAFDANGTTGCSGTPRTCTPLWTAPFPSKTSVQVAGGQVYLVQDRQIVVLDPAGVAGCSGTPKVCQARWTTAPLPSTKQFLAPAAVAGSSLFATDVDGGLHVYPAAPDASCTGSPLVCPERWQAPHAYSTPAVPFSGWIGPVVAGGRAFTYGTDPSGRARLSVFDASGTTGCSGVPKVCAPSWTTLLPGGPTDAQLAVASDRVYAVSRTTGTILNSGNDVLTAWAVDGSGCTGTPATCFPLWQTTSTLSGRFAAPTVAGGLVYEQSGSTVSVFRTDVCPYGCAGHPATSLPLAPVAQLAAPDGHVDVSVAMGRVYLLGTTDPPGGPETATLTMYA